MMDHAAHAKHGSAQQAKTQELLIEGAGCASCVGKIEKALQAVAGVERAEMNFAARTVAVTGTAAAESLIQAVENAGYNATVPAAESDEALMDEKEAADLKYYHRLLWEMTIALLLGVPLMIYGLVVGEMTVTTTGERIAWLLVGLLTMGVMFFSGKHFYVGAWKSFGITAPTWTP